MIKMEVLENKNNIVKKHNDLVNKARFSLSEQSIKLLSILISMIRKDDETFQEYVIKVSDFAELKGSVSKKNNEYVRQIIDELLSNPIRIGDLQANFIASAEYKNGEATAIFEISQRMKPYLLQLRKDFMAYNINDILSLKSSYVIRFYELVYKEWKQYKRYNKEAKSYTFDIDLEELRELFEIPKSYQYCHLKERVIEKAKAQFTEKTNIKFTYEEYKIGRKVTRIKITVKDNNKGSADFLSNRKNFIDYIRETYKPIPDKNVFPIIISTNQGDFKVNLEGHLYLSGETLTQYNNKQANQLWDWLYKLVKENPKLLKNPK